MTITNRINHLIRFIDVTTFATTIVNLPIETYPIGHTGLQPKDAIIYTKEIKK